MRRPVRIALAVAVVCLWLVVTGGSAEAHALLRSSQPVNGATLDRAPVIVVCTFTEPPDPRLSSLHVLDTSGRSVEKASAIGVAGDTDSLEVALPASLPDGTYTVTWRTVSKVDGHVAGGSFAFGVGQAQTTSGIRPAQVSSTPRPGTLTVVGRWAFLVGLIVLFGGAITGLVVYGGRLPTRPGPLLWIGSGLSAGGLVGMGIAEHHAIGASWGGLFRSSPGRYLIAQAVGVAAVLVATAAVRWRVRVWSLVELAVAGGGTLLVHVMAGHANTPGGDRVGNLAVQWVHVLAAATWIGGLAWLLWYLRSHDAVDRAARVRRFSQTATIALAVVATTGVLRAWSEVGSVHQLRSTDFGRVLDVKLGLFVVLLGFGAVNRFWLVPALTHGRPRGEFLRRTVTGELAVAVPLLLAAATLSQLSPAAYTSSPTAAQTDRIVARGSDYGTTIRAQLTVAPGTPGPNAFTVRLTDYDSGRPVAATRVQLRFALPAQPNVGATTLELTAAGAGLWRGNGTPLSLAGRWTATILVQQRSGSVTAALTVQTRSPKQRIEVQRAAGQPDIYTITLADGSVMQTYIDPGTAGPNAVHATFFKPSGEEESIARVQFTAISPTATHSTPKPFRFDKGHFDINIPLVAGRWAFEIVGTTPDGRSLSGHFDQTIGPTDGG